MAENSIGQQVFFKKLKCFIVYRPSAGSVQKSICLHEVFVQTERRRSEVCAKKPKANTSRYRPSKRG